MKTSRVLLLLALLTSALTAASPEPLISGTASADFVSRYVFRGVALASESVQPAVNIQCGPVYGNVWASQSLHRRHTDEVDYTLGAGVSGLDLGATAYSYPSGGGTTYEPFVGYGRDLGDLAKGSVCAYRDFTLHTTTFEGKLSAKVASSKRIEATVDGVLGHTTGYTYWGAGPVLKCKFSEKTAASVALQYGETSATEAVWSGRFGVSYGF